MEKLPMATQMYDYGHSIQQKHETGSLTEAI